MKKKIKNFIIALAFLGLGAPTVFQSCNYLDIDPYITDLFTLDSVFVRKEYTQKYLTYLYSYLIDNGSNVHYEYTMPYNFITDEGSWIRVYDENCKRISQMSSSNIRVISAAGNSFTTKEGSWLRVYDEKCKRISQRSV